MVLMKDGSGSSGESGQGVSGTIAIRLRGATERRLTRPYLTSRAVPEKEQIFPHLLFLRQPRHNRKQWKTKQKCNKNGADGGSRRSSVCFRPRVYFRRDKFRGKLSEKLNCLLATAAALKISLNSGERARAKRN